MADRRIQAVVTCIICLALALVGMTIGVIVRASKNGGLRKGGEGGDSTDFSVEGDDYVFGGHSYHEEAFPNDELNTLTAHEEALPIHDNAETEVTRGFQLFDTDPKNTASQEASVDDERTKTFRVRSKMEFFFGQDGRPSSAEKGLLVEETELFLTDQLSEAWAVDFVDLELADVEFPTRIVEGVPTYSYRMEFFTKVTVRQSSLQGRDDFLALLPTLDYNGNYMKNYVWNAVAGEYWQVFASVTDVAFGQ